MPFIKFFKRCTQPQVTVSDTGSLAQLENNHERVPPPNSTVFYMENGFIFNFQPPALKTNKTKVNFPVNQKQPVASRLLRKKHSSNNSFSTQVVPAFIQPKENLLLTETSAFNSLNGCCIEKPQTISGIESDDSVIDFVNEEEVKVVGIFPDQSSLSLSKSNPFSVQSGGEGKDNLYGSKVKSVVKFDSFEFKCAPILSMLNNSDKKGKRATQLFLEELLCLCRRERRSFVKGILQKKLVHNTYYKGLPENAPPPYELKHGRVIYLYTYVKKSGKRERSDSRPFALNLGVDTYDFTKDEEIELTRRMEQKLAQAEKEMSIGFLLEMLVELTMKFLLIPFAILLAVCGLFMANEVKERRLKATLTAKEEPKNSLPEKLKHFSD